MPVTEPWRQAVLEKVAKRGEQAKLARVIRCSPSTLNELLHNRSDDSETSVLVWRINRHYGWEMPKLPAFGSSDQHEIEVFLKRGGKRGRAIFQKLRAITDDDAKMQLVDQLLSQITPPQSK